MKPSRIIPAVVVAVLLVATFGFLSLRGTTSTAAPGHTTPDPVPFTASASSTPAEEAAPPPAPSPAVQSATAVAVAEAAEPNPVVAAVPAAAPTTPEDQTPQDLGPALEVAPSGGDDTASLQRTIDEAAAQGIGVRLNAGASYTTTAELELKKGLTAFDGRNATIMAKLPTPVNGHPGNVFRFTTHSSRTILTRVRIDLTGSVDQTRGVLAATVTDVTISHLDIRGIRFRGIDVVANQGPVQNLDIHHNVLNAPLGTEDTPGIVPLGVSTPSVADRFSGPSSAAYDRFRETGRIAEPQHTLTRVKVRNNHIDGGYYGIALHGATHCTITGNTATNNVRNLSMQDRSDHNTVSGNTFSESLSSSIHLAYGSSHNTVVKNSIRTGRAVGQGLLQAYQGSTGNTFLENNVEVHGGGRPSWFLYVGTGSHDTTFEKNTLTGAAGSAVAAAESIWDHRSATAQGTHPNPHSYTGSRTTHPGDGRFVDFAGGYEDLRGVAFLGNILHTQGVPFYLGAEVTFGPNDTQPAVGNLTGVRIAGNQLRGSGYDSPIVEHRGTLPDVGTAQISYTEKQ